MSAIRFVFLAISLGALMLHGTCAADPAVPRPDAGQKAGNQNAGNGAAAQSGDKSGGDQQATNKLSETKKAGKGHATDNTGKTAPIEASNARGESKHQGKQGNADGKHQADKETPGNTVTTTDTPDLHPSRPDSQEPPKPLHPNKTLPGKGAAKTATQKSQTKGTKQSSTTEASSAKTPSVPMASAEAASTRKKVAPPSSPMASAEAGAVGKKTNDLHEASAKTLEKVDSKPEKDKNHDHPRLVMSQQPGSSLNGTSSALPRGKSFPLAAIDGSKISKTAKGAAGITGTGLR